MGERLTIASQPKARLPCILFLINLLLSRCLHVGTAEQAVASTQPFELTDVPKLQLRWCARLMILRSRRCGPRISEMGVELNTWTR